MPAPTNTNAVSIDIATAQLLTDLLIEKAEGTEKLAGEAGQTLMLAPMVTYLKGKARQIREQMPEMNGK